MGLTHLEVLGSLGQCPRQIAQKPREQLAQARDFNTRRFFTERELHTKPGLKSGLVFLVGKLAAEKLVARLRLGITPSFSAYVDV